MYTKNNNHTKGTVLIVDDTPGNLAILSDLLSEADYRVLVATDGVSALEQIEYVKPDIILLDVLMPGIDGFETCRQLKNSRSTLHIPIVFMTGLSELESLLRGFEEGAIDYIVKPIRPAEVLARIEAQLAQVRKLQRAEKTLTHAAFSALSFDSSGTITWMTKSAAKALREGLAEIVSSEDQIHPGTRLPDPILKRMPTMDRSVRNELFLGNGMVGRIIPCPNIQEFLLLLHKHTETWDISHLKSSFGLTVREAEILMWISLGKNNKEVGIILNTSPRTVNKHLEHIFVKLGVPTRTAAVAKVLTESHKSY